MTHEQIAREAAQQLLQDYNVPVSYGVPFILDAIKQAQAPVQVECDRLHGIVKNYDRTINALPKDQLVHFSHLLYGDVTEEEE